MVKNAIKRFEPSTASDDEIINAFAAALYNKYLETEEEINAKISLEANLEYSEINRIKKITPQRIAREAQGARFDEGFTSEEADLFGLWDTKDPPITERLLSDALLCTNFGLKGICDGDIEMAIGMLTEAHQYLGMLQGHDQQKIINELEKKALLIAAGYKKNAENINAKKLAIEYYQVNHNSFKNKDEAADCIGKKIVGYPFSTVRKWLKGVDPLDASKDDWLNDEIKF